MKILIFSCSLNPISKSRILAREAEAWLTEAGVETKFIDLQEMTLPMCDGGDAYLDPAVGKLDEIIRNASAILIAGPVYNFYLNAAAKNLIELTGSAWEDKPVGFLCSAGGQRSYMSVMSLANSLMLDFRCLVVPRFVYASKSDYKGEGLHSESVRERIGELCKRIVTLARGLELAEQHEERRVPAADGRQE